MTGAFVFCGCSNMLAINLTIDLPLNKHRLFLSWFSLHKEWISFGPQNIPTFNSLKLSRRINSNHPIMTIMYSHVWVSFCRKSLLLKFPIAAIMIMISITFARKKTVLTRRWWLAKIILRCWYCDQKKRSVHYLATDFTNRQPTFFSYLWVPTTHTMSL